jgi:hypothetical protein
MFMGQNFWTKEMKQRIGRDNLAASVALCREEGGVRGEMNNYKWALKLWTEKFGRKRNNNKIISTRYAPHPVRTTT